MNLLQRIWREIKISIEGSKILSGVIKFLKKYLQKFNNYFSVPFKVFMPFIILIIWLVFSIINIIFGATGDEIRSSSFVKERQYIDFENAQRGDILACDGRIISMEVPRYKITLDFQADILTSTSVNRYRRPEQYKKEVDSLDQLLEDELDSLAVLICDKKILKDNDGNRISLGQKYRLNKRKLRASWRRGKKQKNKKGELDNRDIPLLAYSNRHNPAIDWGTYKTLVSYPPFRAIKRPRDIQIEKKTKKPKRYKSLLCGMYNTARYIEFDRDYPFGRLANATIGTCEPERDKMHYSHGRSGMEEYLDSLLRGRVGHKLVTKSCEVTLKEDSVVKAINGYNIHTTLDMNMQNIVHSELEKQLMKYNARSGHAILLDVKTGAIKALVNLDRKYSNGHRYYVEEKNHAVQDRNEPGSSIKTASMMIALEDSVVSPNDMIDTGYGPFYYKGAIIQDWRSFGKIKVSDVIKQSSNIGIAKIITSHYWTNYATTKERIESYDRYVGKLKALAFDYKMDLPIPLVNTPKIRTKKDWDESAKKRITGPFSASALSSMSYGYALELPSIYIAAFYNGIANGGKLMKPYLIKQISQTDKDGNETIIEEYSPTVQKEAMASPETIKKIKMMLREVTQRDGTGKRAYSEDIAISGKTATAKVYNPKTGRYYDSKDKIYRVSFSSFFPSEDPRYTCFVLVDRADINQGFPIGGGATAAPVVLSIAKRLLALGTPKAIDGAKDEKYLQRKENKKDKQQRSIAKRVPYFIGMNADAAYFLARKCGYDVHFEGHGKVVKQNIPAKQRLKKGRTIRLTLK